MSNTVKEAKVWWRDEPLADHERALIDAVFLAHNDSAFRDNASSVAVGTNARFSDDLSKSIVAGLMSLGDKHAPIEKTYYFLLLDNPAHEVFRILKHNNRVPGWGGTFQKDEPDPIWENVREVLASFYRDTWEKLESVTDELHKHGKKIYANPSAYTAAAAIVLGLKPKLASYLFIMGRLTAWTQIAAYNMDRKEET
jgi:citrate synthase